MPVRAVDDKSSDTLVVVSGEGFWTGSSTLPHLHQHLSLVDYAAVIARDVTVVLSRSTSDIRHNEQRRSSRPCQ